MFDDDEIEPEVRALMDGPPHETEDAPEAEPQAPPPPEPVQQPAQQPAQQPQPLAPTPEQPWANSPLAELAQRLPAGLKHQIRRGEISVEQAVAHHYRGYHRAVDKFRGQADQATQQAQQAQQAQQQLAGRLEKIMKHLTDTLGLQLPEEEQPKPEGQQAPQNPELAALTGKMDAVLQLEEDRRIDAAVETVTLWAREDTAQVAQEEPEIEGALSFVSERLMEQFAGATRQAFETYLLSQDPRVFNGVVRPEYLRALVEGEMTEAEVITRMGIERAMDTVAMIQHQHYRTGTSVARDVLGVARRMGWKPSREGGEPPASESALSPAPQPPQAPRQPAPPRPDPALQRVRGNMVHQPAPAASGHLDAAHAAATVANMTQQEFDRMMEEAAAAGGPEGVERLMRHIHSLASHVAG